LVFPECRDAVRHTGPENLSIDQTALTRRRDTLLKVLKESGYTALPRKARSMSGQVAGRRPGAVVDGTCKPRCLRHAGRIMNAPGYFRISLTASDEMVATQSSRISGSGETTILM
jgi:hypothetical protein